MKFYTILLVLIFSVSLVGCTRDNPPPLKIDEAITTIELPEMVSANLFLTLPNTYESVSITWTSDDSSVIDTTTGRVYLTTEPTTVTLTATFSENNESKSVTYTIIVGPTDEMVLTKIKSNLVLPSLIIYETTLDFIETIDGATIEWVTDQESFISNNGVVTLPNEGEEISVTVTATINYKALTDTKIFTVRVNHLTRIHYHEEVTLISYYQAPVWTGEISGEVPKPSTPPCFPGAWYNKAVSSKDQWLGIETVLTIPEYNEWAGRYDADLGRHLDNASIYLGGNAGAETDVGLFWTLGCNNAFCLSPGSEKIAFRPFWRYIHGGSNTFAHEDYRKPQYYYLPGDTIRMTVFSPEPNFLQMEIQVIEATTIEKYVALRASWRIEDNMPSDFVSPKFPSNGHGGTSAEFKRVNAIDQVNNEGKPAKYTETSVDNAIWHEVYLYREINGTIYKVPFNDSRRTTMLCPDPNAFTLDYDSVDASLGGEFVSIHPRSTKEDDES
ncbi:immunoglobulin-like domain-containing protein [Liberiplasma polymorphum]|uniref:immunoglobulin-like domain-containing protein n=1 Tax=Liberiplasma polymorphum TaxID=3374570 RepID=UPI0037758CBC